MYTDQGILEIYSIETDETDKETILYSINGVEHQISEELDRPVIYVVMVCASIIFVVAISVFNSEMEEMRCRSSECFWKRIL